MVVGLDKYSKKSIETQNQCTLPKITLEHIYRWACAFNSVALSTGWAFAVDHPFKFFAQLYSGHSSTLAKTTCSHLTFVKFLLVCLIGCFHELFCDPLHTIRYSAFIWPKVYTQHLEYKSRRWEHMQGVKKKSCFWSLFCSHQHPILPCHPSEKCIVSDTLASICYGMGAINLKF